MQSLPRFFRALGDDHRLRIVTLLAHGELCVCHIEKALAVPQPTASRHLGILRSAGIVQARRSGAWIHYRLVQPDDRVCREHLKSIVARSRKDAATKKLAAKLVTSMGPGACR